MKREGAGGRRRHDGRSPSAVVAALQGRFVACLLAGIVVLLATGVAAAPAAAADAPDSIRLDATYDVSATLKWASRKLIVSSTAQITNNTDAAVDALTFNAIPAEIGWMRLREVRVGDEAASATLDDQNIIVALPLPLEPTQQITVTIVYVAWFGTGTGGKQWLFIKRSGVAVAYRWIPWLSKPNQFATPTFGEPFVTAVSQEVRVSITTDRPLVIATNGHLTGVVGLTSTYVATRVRDFNFTASPGYLTHTANWGDVAITYYYRDIPLSKLANATIDSLERFSQRVGPYPYDDLAVAETPAGASMESPGMVWISRTAPKSLVRYAVVHEMAHQWFYGVVGSDQATQPFADEAMAEFLTRDLLGHRGSTCAESVLDRRVYDYSAGCYYEVIYIQGDRYLDSYRQRVGDAAFWDGMRRYYDQFKFDIGGTRRLLETLDEAAADAGAPGGGHDGRFPSLYPGAGG